MGIVFLVRCNLFLFCLTTTNTNRMQKNNVWKKYEMLSKKERENQDLINLLRDYDERKFN